MGTIFSNINSNAPWPYKRFETGMIAILIPTFTGFITSIPMTDNHKVYYLAGSVFLGGLVKFIGVLLGVSNGNGNGNGNGTTTDPK